MTQSQRTEQSHVARLLLARMDAESWAKSLVEESITEDMIEERAAEIADERREDE